MKSFLLSVFLLVAVNFCSAAEKFNGTFYVSENVECHLISQNGLVVTNNLNSGKTYLTPTSGILELVSTNKITYYFSGGVIVEALANSTISIDVFDQEIQNLNDLPKLAKFGIQVVSITLNKGEFNIVYPIVIEGSSFTVNTPYAAYQLDKGSFFFRVSDKSTIAFVGEGTMQVYSDKKKTDIPKKGDLSIIVPLSETGLTDKYITSIKTLKQDEIERYTAPLQVVRQKTNDVKFIVISGKVVGVWMQ